MAKRRCFSIDLLESDKYLDLSLEAKALYVHLNLKSDDEGVIINPVSALRFLNTDRKFLDELIEKGFVLYFDGLYIVAHWHLHNQISPSKRNPSLYQNKLKKLIINDEKMYVPILRQAVVSNT
ncbi:MAG: hypothetical protein IJZ54_06100 [Clostridia bacterium]|nr:hypothetical protein [Clostridia bacterium]